MCLTCKARARSIMMREVVHTHHGRSAKVGWIRRRRGHGESLVWMGSCGRGLEHGGTSVGRCRRRGEVRNAGEE